MRQSGVRKSWLKQKDTAAQIFQDLTIAQAKTIADRAFQGEVIPEEELVHIELSDTQPTENYIKRATLNMAKNALLQHIGKLSSAKAKPDPQPQFHSQPHTLPLTQSQPLPQQAPKSNFEDYFRSQINARGEELSKYELSDSESDWSD
mmetsp:Transcript_26248/g.46926  ORF Transcript_26248/g.46926 Transcript_26248/m.46926 type:complete len:148 (-) Transcript_26248:6351-6794(-)